MTERCYVTESHLKALFPALENTSGWATSMHDLFDDYGIITVPRVAMFLAQCGYETGGFRKLEENLNYSAERLVVVFKKYFPTIEIALQYARRPEKIANKVYGGRLGNGPESSGDGWKYRGRGCIQLTGKANYEEFAKATWTDWRIIFDNPDRIVQDKVVCILTGLWFWSKRNLNPLCDVENITEVTRRINGGLTGLKERTELFNKAKVILQ